MLQDALGFLNQYANLIMVFTTIVYAFLTYQTVRLMRRQVVANVRVSKVFIQVALNSKKDGGQVARLKDFAKKPFGAFKDSTFIFKVCVDFLNVSSGAGAIDQPKLIIKFAGNDFELEVRPTAERIGSGRRTIFFSGGAFEKMDLDYFVAYNEKFIALLKKNPEKIEYYIRYKDNLGKKHLVRITEVEGLA